MKNTKHLIAIVRNLEPLVAREHNAPEIRVIVGTLSPRDNKPRNWSLDMDEPRNSAGGCGAHIFASGHCGDLFSSWGPEVQYGSLPNYEHGLSALKMVERRLKKIRNVRGMPADAAESMGRWLEACGVTEVYRRPNNQEREWHTEGEWIVEPIGEFIDRVRYNLSVNVAKRHAEQSEQSAA